MHATYEPNCGSSVDVLEEMKDKPDGELDESQKNEGKAKLKSNLLKQSSEDQISADGTDIDQEISSKASSGVHNSKKKYSSAESAKSVKSDEHEPNSTSAES